LLDEDQVEQLKRSKRSVGELTPIVKDTRTGKIISGLHRERAGWKKVVWIDTKDDLQFWKLKMHFNIQRELPPAEWAEMFTAYAEAMEKSGLSNKEIVDALIADSPFHPNYTYEYIPDRYKQFRPSRFQEPEKSPVQIPEHLPPTVIEREDEVGPKLAEVRCPCGCDWVMYVDRRTFEVVRSVGPPFHHA